jgi:hypothetical protein
MNNLLLNKKLFNENHYDYFSGLDKAWKNFQIVMQEENKNKKDKGFVKSITKKA